MGCIRSIAPIRLRWRSLRWSRAGWRDGGGSRSGRPKSNRCNKSNRWSTKAGQRSLGRGEMVSGR